MSVVRVTCLAILVTIILVTSSTWAQTNQCLDFDNSAVLLPNEMLEGMTDWTLEVWVRRDGDPMGNQRVFSGCATDNSGWTYLSLNDLGMLSVAADQIGFTLVQDIYYQGDTWYHFAMVVEGGNLALYKNGVQLHNVNQGTPTMSLDGVALGQFVTGWLGPDQPNTGLWHATEALDGTLDELRVWSTARTAQQLADNYMSSVDPGDADLRAYYNFNNVTDQTVTDLTGNGWDGWLGSSAADTDYDPTVVESDAPFTDNNLSPESGPELTLNPMSHDFGQLNFWETDSVAVVYSNTGDETLTISNISLSNAGNYSPTLPYTHVLEPSDSHTQWILLNPVDSGQQDATLTFSSDDPDEPQKQVTFTATILNPPPDADVTISEIDFGTRPMNGSYGITLSIENVGGQTLTVSNPTVNLPDFSTEILANDAAHGEFVEVQIVFSPPLPDPANYDATFTLATNDPTLPVLALPVLANGDFATPEFEVGAGWTMFSLPYNPGADITFGDLFSDDLNGLVWQIAAFDMPQGWYWADLDEVYQPGHGYWLQVSGLAPDATISLDYGGATGYGDLATQIELDFDWNLISVPYGQPCDLDDLIFHWQGDNYSYDQMLNLQRIYPFTYHLSAMEGGYQAQGDSYIVDTTLEPFKGYWLRTADDGLTMTFPAIEDITPDPGPIIDSDTRPGYPGDLNEIDWVIGDDTLPSTDEIDEQNGWDDWTLRFMITGGQQVFSLPSLGLHPDATDEYDYKEDAPRGPTNPFGSSDIHASFLHPEWQQGSSSFARDIHGAIAPGDATSWVLTVTAPAGTPLELLWPEVLSDVPDGYTVTLRNEDNGDCFQAHTLPSYQFDCDGTTEFTITVEALVTAAKEVRKSALIPTEFAISNAYPNPFNPALTVEIELPEPSRLTVTVYDIMGREVARLADRDLQPGFHHLNWNAAYHATGVYFVRLQAGHHTDVRKVMLLK